ncbi:MAG: hypothetical protein ACJA2X_001844 [Halocynthiibacter sp.]
MNDTLNICFFLSFVAPTNIKAQARNACAPDSRRLLFN